MTVFKYIGIPYAEDIIRFVIITALLSAANSGLFAASRMMWSLSAKNQLPKILRNSRRLEHLLLPLLTMFGAIRVAFRTICARNNF
ncbi:hypothetical protein AB3538_05440 [Acinetobacter baumannii]